MRASPSLEIPSDVPANLRPFLESVRELLEIADGFRGDKKDRYVTLGELEAAGLVKAVEREGRAEIASAKTGTLTKLVKVGVTNTADGRVVTIEGGGTTGTITFDSFASGIEPIGLVDALPDPSGYTGPKVVFLTTDGKLYRLVSGAWTKVIDPADIGGPIDPDLIEDGSVAGTKFAAGIQPIGVVDVLPTISGYTGPKVVFLTTDGKLYRLTGSPLAWEYKLPAADLAGQIGAGQIAPASIGFGELAAGINPVEVVGTLPTTGLTDGRIVLLTTDNRIYRYSTATSDWEPAETYIPDGSVGPGQLAANAVIAGKIAAGAVRAGEIAADAVLATNIAAGQVIAGKLAANAVEASNIAANAVTAGKVAAGAIGADQIQANAITATKIAALQISTDKLAANSVTSEKILAGEVKAVNLAADSVVAGKIAAAAISARELAAEAVEADKIKAGAIQAIHIDAGAITADKLESDLVVGGIIRTGGATRVELEGDATFPIWIGSGAKGTLSGLPGAGAKFWYDIVTGKLFMTGTLQNPEVVGGTQTLFRPRTEAGLEFDLAITRLFEWNANTALNQSWQAVGPEIEWFAPDHGLDADAYKRVQATTEGILLNANVDLRNVASSSARTVEFRFTCQFDGAGAWAPVTGKWIWVPVLGVTPVDEITVKTFNPIVYQTINAQIIRRSTIEGEVPTYGGPRNFVRYRLEARLDPTKSFANGAAIFGGSIVASCSNFGSRVTSINQ